MGSWDTPTQGVSKTTEEIRQPLLGVGFWPETAVPILKEHAEGYLTMMAGFANQRESALITGVPVRQPNAAGELRYYNGLTSTGDGAGTYLKQKLVPFGEYVPLQDLLRGLIAFFDLPMSDFAREIGRASCRERV